RGWTSWRGSRAYASACARWAGRSASRELRRVGKKAAEATSVEYRRPPPGAALVHNRLGNLGPRRNRLHVSHSPAEQRVPSGFSTGVERCVEDRENPCKPACFPPLGRPYRRASLALSAVILSRASSQAGGRSGIVEQQLELTADGLWSEVARRLRESLNERTYGTWFGNARGGELSEDSFVI